MEATVSHIEEHDDDKENYNIIIPFVSTKEISNAPILEKAKIAVPIVNRRFRRPLQDITHLFITTNSLPPLLQLSDLGFYSPLNSTLAAVNSRKRKISDGNEFDDSVMKTASKILRKEFR
ncbi:hypothetical protein ACH5RR_028640 [Cinchona calisaya]|uniref:Uncharacterized protein n=1 Tax=Cinchona calisaya TaxID=153742 RepID=A0ABD2YR80_9GENT